MCALYREVLDFTLTSTEISTSICGKSKHANTLLWWKKFMFRGLMCYDQSLKNVKLHKNSQIWSVLTKSTFFFSFPSKYKTIKQSNGSRPGPDTSLKMDRVTNGYSGIHLTTNFLARYDDKQFYCFKEPFSIRAPHLRDHNKIAVFNSSDILC